MWKLSWSTLPSDGSFVTTSMMLLIPTSRRSVSMTSASPTDIPLINPNRFATESDRVALIYGVRHTLQAMLDTAAMGKVVDTDL